MREKMKKILHNSKIMYIFVKKLEIMKELWIKYEFGKTHPPRAGRYLVYRQKCDKWHQEVWNGTGWASNNNDITHYIDVKTP